MVLLVLGEMEGKLQGRDFDLTDLQEFDWYEPELIKLEQAGVVEVEGKCRWDDPPGYFAQSGGKRWRVSGASFLWWVALDLLPKTRRGPEFEKWIHDR
jgi:hypothetical protein